jgi:hypothetical protein
MPSAVCYPLSVVCCLLCLCAYCLLSPVSCLPPPVRMTGLLRSLDVILIAYVVLCFCCLLSAIYRRPSAVCILFVVCCLLFATCCLLPAVRMTDLLRSLHDILIANVVLFLHCLPSAVCCLLSVWCLSSVVCCLYAVH